MNDNIQSQIAEIRTEIAELKHANHLLKARGDVIESANFQLDVVDPTVKEEK